MTTDGEQVGTHNGIEHFTIGQRKGLGVAMGEPYFVVRIDAEDRRVVIGKKESLAREELTADRTNWLVNVSDEPFLAKVQIRYGSVAHPAMVQRLGNERLHVRFEVSCYGVAPGQAVVVYRDDQVLGGGWIE